MYANRSRDLSDARQGAICDGPSRRFVLFTRGRHALAVHSNGHIARQVKCVTIVIGDRRNRVVPGHVLVLLRRSVMVMMVPSAMVMVVVTMPVQVDMRARIMVTRLRNSRPGM